MLRRVALVYLAAALAAGIAGCGSSGGTGPLGSDSVATIITEAKANTIATQSVTVSGGPSASLSVNLTIVRGVGCSGTITQGAVGKSTLIWIGKAVYAHTESTPANEWMRGTSSDSDLQGLLSLCMPGKFLEALSTSGVSNATRSVTVYHGQPALALALPATGQGNGQRGMIVVTDTAKPVLLSISEAGSGSFTFTGYGATKTIKPPAAS